MAASSSRLLLRVYIKASDEDAVDVEVPPQQGVPAIRSAVARTLATRLRSHYPRDDWELLDHNLTPLKSASALTHGGTVVAGKRNEDLVCRLSVDVRHQPHHNVMTVQGALMGVSVLCVSAGLST